MKKEASKKIILYVIGIAILFVAVIGITYAVFAFTSAGKVENKVTTGYITMNYTESSNEISIDNAVPTTDSVGKVSNDYFDFSISTEIGGSINVNYEVRAEKLETESIPINDYDIKLYLEKFENGEYVSKLEPSSFEITSSSILNDNEVNKDTMLLYRGNFKNESNDVKRFKDDFRFRMWLADNAVIDENEKEFKVKINVYSSAN